MEYLILFACGFILGWNLKPAARRSVNITGLNSSITARIRNSQDYYKEALERCRRGEPFIEYLDYCDEEIRKANELIERFKVINKI